MAIPSSVFTEMVTTTLRYTANEVADNVSDHNAFLNRMKSKNKIETVSGGYEAQYPILYNENDTYQRYSGYDTLNTNASDVITSAKYDWSQVAIHVTASGREIRQNMGPQAMKKLVKIRKDAAVKTAANNFSVDLYSDGSLQNQIGGLAHIVQTNGQGTVGGINSTDYTFWRNKFREITGSDAYTKDTIQSEMNALWMSLTRGTDTPDMIIMSHDFFSVFESSLQQNARYTNDNAKGTGNVGFMSYKYKGADVFFDDNTNFTTTAEKAYFLNTDYLHLVQHREAQWSPEDQKTPINQDAIVVPMYWMGFLASSGRQFQGVMIDAA